MANIALQVEDLQKEYGELVAVEGADFEIEEGEFVSILGPSGSGKSTILRMVAGFESPTTGTVTVAGHDITDQPPFERDTNMVFQHLALFPHLTVRQNIEYGLKQQGVEQSKRKQAVEEMLEMVQLEGYEDRDIDELSGGEQQRVALARSIVNEPEVVLFDEPLASLDRKLRQHMQFELQRIQKETGITFLYVTHDQEIALSVSDRLIILNEGDIEQIGSAEELYEQPRSQFVANFLGDINALPARVTHSTETDVVFATDDVELEYDRTAIRTPDDSTLVDGASVHIAVRPHTVSINPDADGGIISGTVQNRMYRGNETAYSVATTWGEFLVIDDVEADTIDIGSTVSLTWAVDDVFVFADQEDT